MWEIAVIDDDPIIPKVLSAVLSKQGYTTGSFDSGLAFLEYVKENDITNVTLLIVDILMPDLKGTELVKKLAQKGILHNIPVLFLSGLGNDEDITEAHQCAEMALTVDYVRKPFQTGWLTARVKNLIKLKKYHDDLFKTNSKIMDMNLEVGNLMEKTSGTNEQLKKLTTILNRENLEFQKKIKDVKENIQEMITHDLPIVKLVAKILEQTKILIEEVSEGISEEEELFKILPSTLIPLQSVSMDMENIAKHLIEIGMVNRKDLNCVDIKSTPFYFMIEKVHERGGISEELFNSFIDLAKLNF